MLIAVESADGPWDAQTSLDELAVLCESAGLDPVDRIWQRLPHPHPTHYVGKGKLDEVRERVALGAVDVVVADDELPPRVQATLEEELKRRVVDRTAVILDIFAQRARTHEGRIQVELAQYEFMLPRLRSIWSGWERTGGGIGTRGPGETQLESDRRRVRHRITHLRREIDLLRQHRQRVRRRRQLGGLPLVALVGYTNVGKTSLLRELTGESTARAADAPFVTLDPLTRVMDFESGQQVMVSDTVGFISKLPAALIAAFRATLEELDDADLLVHVLDITDPHVETAAAIVRSTLKDLGLDDKPTLLVLNKADAAPLGVVLDLTEEFKRGGGSELEPIVTSAQTGEGINALKAAIAHWAVGRTPWVRVRIPYERSDLVDLFYRRGHPIHTDYGEAGTEIEGTLPGNLVGRFQPYLLDGDRAGNGASEPRTLRGSRAGRRISG